MYSPYYGRQNYYVIPDGLLEADVFSASYYGTNSVDLFPPYGGTNRRTLEIRSIQNARTVPLLGTSRGV
jgi:hypothetical protein